MTPTTITWDDVREQYWRAEQMEAQTVEAYAQVGDSLLALKAATPHGEFTVRCAEVFDETRHGESDLAAAQRRASRYMRLATHRAIWLPLNPKSLNEAMKMLPSKKAARAAPKTAFPGLHQRLNEAGLTKPNDSGQRRRKMRALICEQAGWDTLPDSIQTDPVVSQKLDKAIAALVAARPAAQTRKSEVAAQQYADHRREVASLSETAQQKLERLVARELKFRHETLDKEVREAANAMIPERISVYEELKAKATKEFLQYATMRKGIQAQLSEADYRFLLNVLHPDRAPEDRKEKFARAFDIVRKLDPYIQAVKA